MAGRGGMCKNPFGGMERLTDNDFSGYGARGVLFQNLNDCLIGYWGFGLGENYVTPEMFLDSYDHMFIDRDLSKCPRIIEEVAEDETGKRRRRTIYLTDADVRYRSFAWQYDHLGYNVKGSQRRTRTPRVSAPRKRPQRRPPSRPQVRPTEISARY